ncbi:MAG: hypothetical protein GY862_24760, partial [Gammaproteobacteria bacterium]|nr:hypothetical protein [Gammaproteobacteria bacterium]
MTLAENIPLATAIFTEKIAKPNGELDEAQAQVIKLRLLLAFEEVSELQKIMCPGVQKFIFAK